MLKVPPPGWALVYVLLALAISWQLDWPKMPGFPLPLLGIVLVSVPWILPSGLSFRFGVKALKSTQPHPPIASSSPSDHTVLHATLCISDWS